MSYKKKKKTGKRQEKNITQNKEQDQLYKILVKEINNFNKKLHNLPPNTFIDMRI